MRALGVHQNIPASDTKLTPSLGIYYMSHPLVMDEPIRVNPRAITSPPKMSLLLEVERMPLVIIKPSLDIVTFCATHRDKIFNSWKQMRIQNLNRIVCTPDASPRRLQFN